MQLLIFIISYPFIWLISRLPMKVLYLISNLLYFLIYYVFNYRKKVVLENLKMVFPKKSIKERNLISKKFFKHFTDLFMETIKAISISEKEILKRYQFTNPELVKEFLDKGRSIAFVSAHLGNWEWFASSPLLLKCNAKGAYTSLGNVYFDRVVKKSRERFGFICYKSSKTAQAFFSDYKNQVQAMYVLISDQSPQLEHTIYWQNFLGIYVPVHVGAETLSKKFNLVVINCATKKIKRGTYETTFELLAENPNDYRNYSITDKYLAVSEKNIKRQPECYLWSHRRFKHKDRFEEWKKLKTSKLKINK